MKKSKSIPFMFLIVALSTIGFAMIFADDISASTKTEAINDSPFINHRTVGGDIPESIDPISRSSGIDFQTRTPGGDIPD